MSDLISRAMLCNALCDKYERGEIFAVIQSMPVVDTCNRLGNDSDESNDYVLSVLNHQIGVIRGIADIVRLGSSMSSLPHEMIAAELVRAIDESQKAIDLLQRRMTESAL